MSNQALRGTRSKYAIRNPQRLASGNRWLDKTRTTIHQEPAPAICEGVPKQDNPDHPVEALHRIAAQAAAMKTLLEDAQKQRKLTTEEGLSLRASQSITRNLSAVARSIEPLLPDAEEE